MINITEGIIFLVPALQLMECFRESVARLIHALDEVSGVKPRFLKRFSSYRPFRDEIFTYISELLEAALEDREGLLSEAEIVVLVRIGHTPDVGMSTRTHLNHIIKFLLIDLHRMQCLILPYRFTRPQASWIDEVSDRYACYTSIAKVFRELDIIRITRSKASLQYDPQERKERTVIQMGVKLALASTWYKPEDVGLEDIREWKEFSLDESEKNSPLPLDQIVDVLKKRFGVRLSVDPIQVREATMNLTKDAIDRMVSRGQQELLESSFCNYSDPIKLVSFMMDDLKLAAASFYGMGIKRLNLEVAWAKVGVDIEVAANTWLRLQAEYAEEQSYENSQILLTCFGRFNLYLFVYLPAWFHKNPGAEFLYPKFPNMFVGRIFYKPKLKSDGMRPLSYWEFSEVMGYEFYYAVGNSLRRFFQHLIDFRPDAAGCEKLSQPIWWLPPTQKAYRTNKHAFTSEHEDVYVKYLEAIATAEPFLDGYVKGMRYRYSDNELAVLDFNEIGYVPVVYLSDGLRPILSVSRRALVLLKIGNEYRYNPATTIFPYCLIRGGLRGQNLQWLSCDTYAIHVDRDIDPQVGLSYLFINTDKIRTEPFTVHCRYAVISQLDRQAKWRADIFSETKAPGFGKSCFYEGNVYSKWGEINCLFCNDAHSGYPVKDEMYAQVITHSMLDFQSWMRRNGDGTVECAAFMGSPRETKSRKTDYYTWEQWQAVRGKSDAVKVATYADPQCGELPFCPVRVRSKLTGHSGRVMHITHLLSRLTPEEVAKTTGQTAKTVMHYDTGADDFRRRFAGVVNTKEPLKRPLIKRADVEGQFEALLLSRGTGDVSRVINEFGLLNFSDVDDSNNKEPGAFEIIANEKSANLVQSSTHVCVRGYVCPAHVMVRFKGRKICPWCPLAVWSLNSIFAVSATRHQLADDFERIQSRLAESRDTFSSEELAMLERELNSLGEELVAWYFLERTLDSLVFKHRESAVGYSQVVGDKDLVTKVVTRHVVERGSAEDFLRRLDEVVEFPTTMSVSFRDKVNRAIRFILAQKGEIYQALLEPVVVSPETRLAALLRDEINKADFDYDKLLRLLEVSDVEWFKHVADARGIKEGGDDS